MDDIDTIVNDLDEREKRDRRVDAPTFAVPGAEAYAPGAQDLPVVPFEHFAKLDLRVATILEVEDVPGARKPLYRLKIDVGELGTRQLVAGIKAVYAKEDLIGRQIVIVANLEPRKIAGILSHGMLLAAEDGEAVGLLSPDREFRPGSKIG
jgi:methionine--tRNA ligase beta chain